MKSTFFHSANEVATYQTVAATVQCANLALFKAMAGVMFKNRMPTDADARAKEVADFFNISAVPSSAAYEEIKRSEPGRWIEAWVALIEISKGAARSIEAGKALEKLMTPAQVAAKMSTAAEAKGIGIEDLGLPEFLVQAARVGAKRAAERKAKNDAPLAAEAAKEIELAFKSMQINSAINLEPHEILQLVERFHESVKDGLAFGLTQGWYMRRGKINPERASELALGAEMLKVAELQREYLTRYAGEDEPGDE